MAQALIPSAQRTKELDNAARLTVVRLCIDAFQDDDFESLFSFLPPDGLHVLGYLGEQLISHAVVTTRWLQPENMSVLKTAYIDAVATSPAYQGRGFGSATMRHLATLISEYDIACLETDRVSFYARLGWELWKGPLAGRTENGLIPTPEQEGVMILRLPRTPSLNPEGLLTIECQEARIW